MQTNDQESGKEILSRLPDHPGSHQIFPFSQYSPFHSLLSTPEPWREPVHYNSHLLQHYQSPITQMECLPPPSEPSPACPIHSQSILNLPH